MSDRAATTDLCIPGNEKGVDRDRQLVEAVQNGRPSAFDELVHRHRMRIVSTLYHLLGNWEDAGDVAQEAFIHAFRSIKKFRGEAQFYTWLYRIAVNFGLKHLRRNKLRKFFSFDRFEKAKDAQEMTESATTETSTDKPLIMKELQEGLTEALDKLSANHRTVVVLAEIEGLSTEKIAAIMGCSDGTVRSRLHYAKEALKISLKRYLRS